MTPPPTSSSPSTPAGPGPGDPAPASTIELDVEGMHCGSCAALIEETLSEHPGVTSASVDLASGRAVVGYTPSLLGVDDLRSAIEQVGYSATPVG